ncbi:MAG TPA: response regulator [Nitrososphaeraceae archaeon]|nr:response regulator [Nitrososphaeraceae archaeon]
MLNNRIVSIVDDELDIALLFCDALRTINGIQVFRFTNPSLALEHLKINAKDYMLIISDLRMPIVNGLQLLKTVKELNPLIRTILMTAFQIDDSLFQEYTTKGIINGFLQKPISLKQLLAEVNKQMIVAV